MKMNELLLETAELKEEIQTTISHPFLFDYIEPPQIDEDKLLFLCLISDIGNENRKECIISTMLVQIALDIHERILLIDLNSESDHKARQLTVLAGDYYSSLYYERLSNIKETQLIRQLANGIKEMNEQKIHFLYGTHFSQEQLMKLICKIESGIVNTFALAFKKKHLLPIIQEFFLLKRLLYEKSGFANRRFSPWLHIFAGHLSNHTVPGKAWMLLPQEMLYKAISVIHKNIIHRFDKMDALFDQSKNDRVIDILKSHLTKYMSEANDYGQQLAEEG